MLDGWWDAMMMTSADAVSDCVRMVLREMAELTCRSSVAEAIVKERKANASLLTTAIRRPLSLLYPPRRHCPAEARRCLLLLPLNGCLLLPKSSLRP